MAISSAIASKYIVCIEEGSFHSDPAKRKPSTYAINWLADEPLSTRSSKNPAENQFKNPAVDRFKRPSSIGSRIPARAVQKTQQRSSSNFPVKKRQIKKTL